ncbi:histidine kinase [Bacillus sp. T33-2]|nr:histidine kinase [Bacillus sp. T33-2]
MYWGFIAVLGAIHLQALLLNLPWKIPVYFTFLLAIFIVAYFYKKHLLRISVLGWCGNGLLFSLQLLLLLIYTAVKPSWIYIVPFLLFFGIEVVRLIGAAKLATLEQDLKQFEEERAHLNETFRVVRSERHDFLKHVVAVHFMLENGKYGEAKGYLDDLVGGYEETNLSIKGEHGVVAGILHQMYRRAQTAGISIVYDLDLPLSTMPLSDKNLVKLLGNLLSNSIDACEAWQKEHNDQAQLSLQFYKRSGLYLLICKNNSLPIPIDILDELFRTYGKTTKSGLHKGLGTKIIQDIVSGHHGFLDFTYKEQEFIVKIKIPAIG